MSFIDAVRSELGETQWQKLDDNIIRRFSANKTKSRLRYIGVVDWIYCSPIGALIARVIQGFAILPKQCARDTRFEFVIDEQGEQILKRRSYYINQEHTPFVFDSSFATSPSLNEEFRGGLGMYLKLQTKRGSLLFSDRGYFIRIGKWRLPIPRWCSVGKFELLHRSIDLTRFQILIRIAHPLFGTLFYQRGEFMKIPLTIKRDY